MAHRFIQSEKGKKKLCINNYMYFKERQIEDKIHWKCEQYQKTKCRARVTTVGDKIFKTLNEHNHLADAANVEAAKICEEVRIKAKNSTDSPHSILSIAFDGCSQAAAGKLPSTDTLKRTMRNIRYKSISGPALPSHRKHITFPEGFTTLPNGDEFLYFDSGNVENRIMIFSTQRNLQLLAESQHWYADGTFKTVPLSFFLLYTLHGLKENISLPLVYALLPDKSQETYQIFLEKIKSSQM